MPAKKVKQYRALADLALRKSTDKDSPEYEQWHEWKQGDVFTAPAHMDIKVAFASGKVEEA